MTVFQNIEWKDKKALNNERYISIYLEKIKTVEASKWRGEGTLL